MTTTSINRNLPGPPAIPLTGWRGNATRFTLDPAKHMLQLYHKYGKLVALNQGYTNYVFIFGPEYTHQVLSNSSAFYNNDLSNLPIKFPEDSPIHYIGSGLTMLNGDIHKQQRRLMMPAFHKKRVEAYRESMLAIAEARLANWQIGQTRDMLKEMRQITLSIALKTLLGLEADPKTEQIRQNLEAWIKSITSTTTLLVPLNLPGTPYHHLLKLSERVTSELKDLIKLKRAQDTDSGDVLSRLIEAQDEDGSRLSDEELIGQTATLFVAGHETTAGALTWTLLLLEQHPAIMADLLDELESKLQGAAPTLEQMNQLPLLEAVIKESMRLLPPGLWFIRHAVAPFELGPYQLPAGTNLVYSPVVTHRDPDLYPQPNRFVPQRWEKINPSPYEYLPFSGGPRMCIGATFAMNEMKLVLPLILQRYRLSLAAGAKVDRAGMNLSSPKNGLPMRLNSPDRHFTKSPLRGNVKELVDLD